MPPRGGESFLGNLVSLEFPVSDCFINAREILKNNATSAQVQMADFGVTHLAVRQANIRAARAEFAAGIVAIKLVVKRRRCQKRGVAILLAQFFATRIDPPSIANNEQYRSGHMRNVPTIPERDKRFFR